MNTREELSRTAAEYVLGTLDGGERAAFKDWMAQDPDVAALVRLWERRFAPLLELSAPARVPATLLDDILSKLPLDLPARTLEPEPADVATEEARPDLSAAAPERDTADPGDGCELDGREPERDPAETPADVPPDSAESDVSLAAAEPQTDLSKPGEPSAPAAPSTEAPKADAEREPPPAPAAPDGVSGDAQAPSEGEAVSPEVASSLAPSAPGPAENGTPREAAPVAPIRADAPPSLPPAEPQTGRGWRRLTALLFILLLLGTGGFVYREMHRPEPQAPPAAEPAVVALAPAPFPEPPAPPAPVEEVADAFAVLGPQPAPAIGLTFDVDSGTVSVLKLPAPPAEGMRYDLWVLTQQDGPRRLASFRETGDVESQAVRELDKARLADTFLIITQEPETQAGPVPTGAPVFAGMAVAR